METNIKEKTIQEIQNLLNNLDELNLDEKIDAINQIKISLHNKSPFKNEPVDCVLWIKSSLIKSNDYNPNRVSKPELALLEHSITQDGYTQPIVGFSDGEIYEVVDGFHRNIIGKECKLVNERIHDYLPLVNINLERTNRTDRIASTIRHNKARGKHQLSSMSDIVIELTRRNWSEEKISKELGMDVDEILRLKHVTGMADLFKDEEFSKAWEI